MYKPPFPMHPMFGGAYQRGTHSVIGNSEALPALMDPSAFGAPINPATMTREFAPAYTQVPEMVPHYGRPTPAACGVGCGQMGNPMSQWMGMTKSCDKPRVYTLNFNVTIPAGTATGVIIEDTEQPQKCFRTTKVIVPGNQVDATGAVVSSDLFNVDFVVGTNPQTVGGSSLTPASVYSQNAQENTVVYDLAYPGINQRIRVQYLGAAPAADISFRASLFGTVVENPNY